MDRGELVGYLIGVDRRRYVPNEPVAQVEEIFVREERQGQGIGRLLMQRFENWARRRQCVQVWIGGPKPRFYESVGYQRSGLFFARPL